MDNLPAKIPFTDAVIREIAMDIGKEAVSHLRTMYPDAYAALGKSGALSLRNCVHNEIIAAVKIEHVDDIAERLKDRSANRKRTHAVFSKIRETT